MDRNKQIDLMRKRNAELTQQLEEMKTLLKQREEVDIDIQEYEVSNNLIEELEDIKQEWLNSLSKLKEYEEEYSELISELRDIKKIMNNMGFRIPLYKKIAMKFKRD